MAGKVSAEYYRDYRAANRERINARLRERRAKNGRVRGDRSAEYAKRPSRAQKVEPLQPLFPHVHHGMAMSFWEDELRMDLEQEAALARLENRDVDDAVRRYRAQERDWSNHTVPIDDFR